MFRLVRHALRVASLGLALAVAARAATQLATNSPFLPPESSGPAVAGDNQPLELRGILVDEGGYRFSVFDPARHTGTWVRLNESGYEFVVKAHDTARDTITLDYQGRVLTLPLRTAKVVAAPFPTEQAAPPPGGATMPAAGPKLSPAEETERINRVREEIARRRALRVQSNQNPSGRK